MKNVLIIGCGLLGSSLVKRIAKKKLAKKIFIFEKYIIPSLKKDKIFENKNEKALKQNKLQAPSKNARHFFLKLVLFLKIVIFLFQLKKKGAKISLWYEDHVADYGPNWRNNLSLIEKNNDLIDTYFITTHPDVIKTTINKGDRYLLADLKIITAILQQNAANNAEIIPK